MEQCELKWAGEAVAREYDSEANWWYIYKNKLADSALEMYPNLTEEEVKRVVTYATSYLYQWGPETEEELEALRANKEGQEMMDEIREEMEDTYDEPHENLLNTINEDKCPICGYERKETK